MSGRICPGPCPDGEPFPHYCQGCTASLRGWLSEIDSACAIIAFSADGYSRDTSYGKIRAGKGSSVAGSVSVPADVLLTISDTLTRWMLMERGTYVRSRRKPASPISEACAWISANLDSYMCQTWQGGGTAARRFFRSIRLIHGQSARLAACSSEAVLKPLPCPARACGRPALVWRPGGEYIRCSVCGKALTLDQYEDLVTAVLEAERQSAQKGRGKRGEPAEPAELVPPPRRIGRPVSEFDLGAARSSGMLFSEDRCELTELYISQCGHCRQMGVNGAASSARTGSGGSGGSGARTG